MGGEGQWDVEFCPKPTAKPTADPRPPQRPCPDPSDPRPSRCPTPVSHSAGEVQAGLLQVGLEVGQQEIPPTLGADVGRAVLVHPLMGAEAAAVGHDHGARGADLGGQRSQPDPKRKEKGEKKGKGRRTRKGRGCCWQAVLLWKGSASWAQ